MFRLIVKLVVILYFGSIAASTCNAKNVVVTSPDGSVMVTVGVNNQRPYYSVVYHGETLVTPSHLGFLLDKGELGAHVKQTHVSRSSVDETWNQVWGEDEAVRNHYNELTIDFQEKTGNQRPMRVMFRVFNDGFGFRYILPHINKEKEFCVMDELTEMNLAHDAKAWSIPSNHTEYFEGIYTPDLLSKKDTVCTPLTIEYEKDLYLAIHEAALEDYASLNLTPRQGENGAVKLLTALTPWQSGVKVYVQGELRTPWRTMIISPTAGGLITSRLMLNLNEPSRIEDTSWIEPGRYIGIWWS